MSEMAGAAQDRFVIGKVFALETGAPVPGAEITVYDLADKRGSLSDGKELTEKDLGTILSSLSLGSSTTDRTGSFEVVFPEPGGPTERDIVLVVTASREAAETPTRLLFLSPQPRRSIARRETFSIGVASARLTASTENPGGAMRAAATAALTVANANRTALHDTLRDAVRTRRAEVETSRNKVTAALESRAKRRFTDANGKVADNYVTPGSDVKNTQKRSLKAFFLRTGAIRMEAAIAPDAAGRAALIEPGGTPVAGLTSKIVRDIIYDRNRHPMGSDWAFYDGLALDCRKRRLINRFSSADADTTSAGSPATSASVQPPATPEDVKRHLGALLDEIKAAGDSAIGNEASGTLAGINGFVHGLDIKGGAADQTAIFDFETLNFAFDHVWQDIFDPVWSSVLAGRLVAAEKFAKIQADPPPDDGAGGDGERGFPRDLLDELAFQTANIHAAAETELGATGVSKSIVGGALDGLSSVGDAIAGAADALVDLVTGGTTGTITGTVPDQTGDEKGNVRDHRTSRQRGKRMKVLNAYLSALDEVIAADYPFTVFGADDSGRAINYGQIVKYRQKWEPKSYQAGELVKTLPLAPRQKVSFSSKRSTKRSYSEKRAEASENTYNSEDSATTRDVAKIVNNATMETAYTLENKANATVPGVGGGGSTSTFKTNFGMNSSRTKETFREQIRKESESFKNSTSVSVETTGSDEFVQEESGEIQNPNDEIAFTCLFYELQRRFEVSEKLHKLTPVILVAEKVWKPSEITPEMIGRYDWIIRRVLLDNSYATALNIISEGGLVARLAGLSDLEDLMEEQFKLVADLRKQLRSDDTAQTDRQRRRSRSLIEIGLEIVGLGGGRANGPTEGLLNEDERARNETEDELRRQEGLLSQAVERFNTSFTEFAAQMIQVKKLQLHIKENVIYYMQAIWDHEDRHQMLMRLRDTQVPVITGQVTYSIAGTEPDEDPPSWEKPIRIVARAQNFDVSDETVDLAEVADLSRHLGFFGNYRIFPLIEINPVSEILAVPFLSGRAGIHDPDTAANFSVGDLERYANCLRETMPDAEFQAILPKVMAALERRLDKARPDSEEIVIPTGSLFIELLPGEYSAMEAFKRQHRAVDVADAVADVITKRLEHLRVAARIAADKLGDPTTEKVVIADPEIADLDNL